MFDDPRLTEATELMVRTLVDIAESSLWIVLFGFSGHAWKVLPTNEAMSGLFTSTFPNDRSETTLNEVFARDGTDFSNRIEAIAYLSRASQTVARSPWIALFGIDGGKWKVLPPSEAVPGSFSATLPNGQGEMTLSEALARTGKEFSDRIEAIDYLSSATKSIGELIENSAEREFLKSWDVAGSIEEMRNSPVSRETFERIQRARNKKAKKSRKKR